MSPNKYRQTSAAAQAVVGLYFPELVMDGKWGSFSQSTFDKLSPVQKTHVENVVSAIAPGETVKTLRNFRIAEKGKYLSQTNSPIALQSDPRYISPAAMTDVINRVSGVSGVSATTLQKFLDLEAGKDKTNTLYDMLSVNSGGYSGLFQFDGKGRAWTDARRFSNTLPPWDGQVWKDPYLSTLAAAFYVRVNTIAIRRLGYKGPITANIAYLMHNQGAGGAYSIITGQKKLVGKQSKFVPMIVAAAMQDAKGLA